MFAEQVVPRTDAMQVFFKHFGVKPSQTWCGRGVQVMGMSQAELFERDILGSKTIRWEKLNRGVSKSGDFPLFSGKVQIVSRTLSGLFLVGAVHRPRKRKRTYRKNPRRVPRQIGKIPEKSGKSQKGQKGQKGRTSPPKGPFRTKNAIALKILVFCYRGSILLSVPICCRFFFPRKNSIRITIAVVNYYRGSELLSQ